MAAVPLALPVTFPVNVPTNPVAVIFPVEGLYVKVPSASGPIFPLPAAPALNQIGSSVIKLAETEGLAGHATAIAIRQS